MKLIKKIAFLTFLGTLMIVLYKDHQSKLLEGPDAPEGTSWVDIEETVDESLDESSDGPAQLNIDIPFYTQAPHGNWDYPWQEACEEASILLVANAFNKMSLDTEEFNRELLELVDWQMEAFGAYEHTTVAQTVEMMEANYGLETVVHDNPSFEDIQEILQKGNLIVAPFAGKLLDNPNFRNGGPPYHMLVIKGYDAEKNQIVTHDVGTRNGADYVYDWSTIEAALHDWHDEDILKGTPRIIEVIHP